MTTAIFRTCISRLITVLVLFAIAFAFPMATSHSQPTTGTTWGKLFRGPFDGWWTGAGVADIITTNDGGYVAILQLSKYEGGSEFSGILKLDRNGNLLWSHLFGRDQESIDDGTRLRHVIQNRDGGYTAIGDVLEKPLGESASVYVTVIRLNADGSVRWQKLYERVRDSVVADAANLLYGQRVYERSDGDLIVTGRLEVGQASPCHPGHFASGLALHLDPNGELLNHYLFDGTSLFLGKERTYYTNSGEYLLITSASTGTEYTTNLQKYTANGELIWSHFFGSNIEPHSVAEVSDGYLLIGAHNRDAVLFKVNPAGNVVWQHAFRVYGDTATSSPVFLEVDRDGGALALFSNGYSTRERTLVKTTADGRLSWTKNYKHANVLVIRPVPAGGYIAGVAGYETLLARLDEGGMLEHACIHLPQEAADVQEVSLDPLSVREGPQRHACSDVLAGGEWRARDGDIRADGSFRQSNVCAPMIDFRPALLDFGNGSIGQDSAPRTVQVSNYNGRTALTIEQVTLSDPLNFRLSRDNCTGQTIYPANRGPSSCEIEVVFQPRRLGKLRATVQLSGLQGSAELPLQGTLTSNLEVAGPTFVSPGQVATYGIRFFNPTDSPIPDAVLVVQLPYAAEYVDSTDNGIYWPERHQVFWKLDTLATTTIGSVGVQVKYRWGLDEGSETPVLAFLNGTDTGVLDVTPYLNYTPIEVTASTELSATEWQAVLAGQAELRRRYEAALQEGFQPGTPVRFTLNSGDPTVSVTLVKPDQKHAIMLSLQGTTVQEQRFAPDRYAVGNDSGGFTLTLSTGAIELWDTPTGQAMPAAISYNHCMVNCALKTIALFVPGAVIETVGNVMDGVDCVACARGDAAACAKCANAALSTVKKVGKRVTVPIGLSLDGINCHRDCSDSRKRDTYVCTTDLKTCAGTIESWLSGKRDVVRTWRCGPNGMWVAVPEFTYCDRWEACVQGAQGAECRECTLDRIDRLASVDLPPALERETVTAFPMSLTSPSATAGSSALPEARLTTDQAAATDLCAAQTASGGFCGIRRTTVRVARDPNAKIGLQGAVLPGQALTYTISYENEGAGEAYGVYILDELSELLDETTLDPGDQGRYITATRTLLWDIGRLAPKGEAGSAGEISFSVRVRADAPIGAEIVNQATVYFPSVPEVTPTNAVINRVQAVAAVPQQVSTNANTPLSITLQGRPASDTGLRFTIVEDPVFGTLNGTAPNLTYTPMNGYNGMDSFAFSVSSGDNTSEPATVIVQVGSFRTHNLVYLPLIQR